MPETFRINVNGAEHAVRADADTPLLYVLRNDLGLNGPKFGCGLAQCGACTAIVGDEATRTCVLPLSDVGDAPEKRRCRRCRPPLQTHFSTQRESVFATFLSGGIASTLR